LDTPDVTNRPPHVIISTGTPDVIITVNTPDVTITVEARVT
jgi:hypothetical protein